MILAATHRRRNSDSFLYGNDPYRLLEKYREYVKHITKMTEIKEEDLDSMVLNWSPTPIIHDMDCSIDNSDDHSEKADTASTDLLTNSNFLLFFLHFRNNGTLFSAQACYLLRAIFGAAVHFFNY